jgi:hypothetical protein
VSHILHFAAMTVCCVAVIRPLACARWVERMPGTALAFWQTVGLTLELSLFGMLFSVVFAPDNQGIVPGLVRLGTNLGGEQVGPVGLAAFGLGVLFVCVRLTVLVLAWLEAGRQRRRHRARLALVAHSADTVPGVEILDHPAPAAYCLPGRHGLVVISTGALRVLDRRHLAAVVAHEHAHLRQRHDLVLLPLLAWRRLMPRSPRLEEAVTAVRLLVEMRADDICCRRLPRHDLAVALTRFSMAGGSFVTPAGGLGAADAAVSARTARLLAHPATTATSAVRLAVLTVAAGLVSTPLSLFVLPV